MVNSLEHFYIGSHNTREFHQDIFDEYKLKNKKLCELNQLQKQFEIKAKKRSQLLASSAALFILAELGIVAEGTFVSLSWDIMEPVSYMMFLFNELMAFGWFFMFISRPKSSTSMRDHLFNRSIEKQWKRNGIDPDEIKRL